MRHKLGYRKLNRTSEHRKALIKNMLNSLIKYEQISTTLPKAKILKPQAKKLITLGKKISLNKSLKGDLVFFAFGKSRRKVTHVGVISKVKSINNKNFIHASSSKGVIETQLFKDYYLKRIKKIKRIL